MVFSVSVLYPNEPDATFDMKYYLSTHMPLVGAKWGPLGLQRWDVVEFSDNTDGKKPYTVQAILTWADEESYGKAREAHGADIFGDVPKFSNKWPLLVNGKVVGSA